jgi:hypothetical protein
VKRILWRLCCCCVVLNEDRLHITVSQNNI